MSKNVAVFVDVANIFYAAKAAGVDIDYVTLLKSATAGRDFVRAYAYTGLDPENENQRQFHAFLARSGYKVISKDIRKYGDGRIKANLDIELVVDMMRMAQHIDIAVVVSGDGDFAPAIRAVQQLGVRCEVISFRGNTSSDLIDVADVFTDITQIARVEKGARSGRRVAAEGDLSMTAVPEKETEGLARRRRSRRDERDEHEERTDRVERAERLERPERPAAEALPGNLIVLPGERLSRAGGPEDGEFDGDIDEAVPGAAEGTSLEAAGDGQLDGTEADRQRRRRRRGGRGRGRGRQQYEAPRPAEGGVDMVTEDEEFLEDEIAPLPQHSTFGSVWDNQLGVTPPPITSAAGEPGIDEEYEDEPEIPEYLLAERRQQRGRGGRPGGMRQPGGRGRGGYQSAVDRERYGRSGTSSFGGGSGNRMDRPRPQGGNRGPRPQQPRPQRPMYQEPMREQERPVTASAEPWSEVPPEVQELLRAELARRQSQGPVRGNEGYRRQESPAAEARPAEPAAASAVADAEPSPARGRRSRSTARSSSGTEAATAEPVTESAAPAKAPSSETATKAPARRGRRPSAASSTAAAPAADVAATEAPEAPAPKPRGRRSSSAAATEAASVNAESAPSEAAAPRTRTTRSKAAAEPSAESSPAASTADSAGGDTAATPRRRTTRRTAAAADTEG